MKRVREIIGADYSVERSDFLSTRIALLDEIIEASGMVWRYQLPYLVSVQDHDQHSLIHRW